MENTSFASHKATSPESLPLVSVIVAVYQAESTLERCINSLLTQSLQDFEIILIDDGSTDRSGSICDEYAARDARIRVHHQPNKGVASARQWGIDHAKGEYSIHCDPDDWVEPDMLNDLYKQALKTDADIVWCDFLQDENGQTKYVKVAPLNDNTNTCLGLIDGRVWGSLVNKLIRHKLYKKFNVNFIPSMCYGEDGYICFNLILHSNVKISYLRKAYYHYVIRKDSLTRKLHRKQTDSMILFIDSVEEKHLGEVFDQALIEAKINCKILMYNTQEYSSRELVNQYHNVNKEIIKRALGLDGNKIKGINGLLLTLLHLHPVASLLHRIHVCLAK